MVAAYIWVEGIADQKFLADVLKSWYGFVFNSKFECIDDENKYRLQIKYPASKDNKSVGISAFTSLKEWKNHITDFQDNVTKGIKNIVIVDADDNFNERKNEIFTTCDGLIDIENLFLWPDNKDNEYRGDLEVLLEKIINPEHQQVLDCFDKYLKCLNKGKYFNPTQKAKIFAYMEALLGSDGDIQERNRDYTNPDHWILDPSKEPLKPLKSFLDSHLLTS